jgi:hypothetical protein
LAKPSQKSYSYNLGLIWLSPLQFRLFGKQPLALSKENNRAGRGGKISSRLSLACLDMTLAEIARLLGNRLPF